MNLCLPQILSRYFYGVAFYIFHRAKRKRINVANGIMNYFLEKCLRLVSGKNKEMG